MIAYCPSIGGVLLIIVEDFLKQSDQVLKCGWILDNLLQSLSSIHCEKQSKLLSVLLSWTSPVLVTSSLTNWIWAM